jgi:hypothetical protein
VFTITADAAQRRRAEGGVVDLVNPKISEVGRPFWLLATLAPTP